MKTIRILFILTVVFLFYSCATMFYDKSKDLVTFNSTPPGATVYINGMNTNMQTPCLIHVKPIRAITKKTGYYKGKKDLRFQEAPAGARIGIEYEIKKNNYAPLKGRFYGRKNNMIYLNYFNFFIGSLIDLATGCNWKYNKEINETLYPLRISDTVVRKEYVYVESKGGKPAYSFEKKSDVDKLIPQTGMTNSYRFALIIGNEDYSSHQVDLSSEINVDFARNDASAFKEYAINILGIPEKNVIFLLDATTGQMNQGISKINLLIKNTQGKAEVFVYYAGHGLPDEQTKEAYIMPVDVSGKNASEGIKLKEMYAKLAEYPSKRVTIFIDACFSGGARNQGLLAARGVKITPKDDILNGNLVVFAASSGEQSSLPFKEKQHGFFTYYLLKKLQESKGDVSYNELSKYIKDNVSLQSVLVNDKEQSPQVNVSNSIISEWESYNLK